MKPLVKSSQIIEKDFHKPRKLSFSGAFLGGSFVIAIDFVFFFSNNCYDMQKIVTFSPIISAVKTDLNVLPIAQQQYKLQRGLLVILRSSFLPPMHLCGFPFETTRDTSHAGWKICRSLPDIFAYCSGSKLHHQSLVKNAKALFYNKPCKSPLARRNREDCLGRNSIPVKKELIHVLYTS